MYKIEGHLIETFGVCSFGIDYLERYTIRLDYDLDRKYQVTNDCLRAAVGKCWKMLFGH